MLNLRGRRREEEVRPEEEVRSKLDEEFDFKIGEEAHDEYGGSDQRKDLKLKSSEKGGDKVKKARTKTWSNVVKVLKIEDGSEIADLVEHSDLDKSNHLKVDRTRR